MCAVRTPINNIFCHVFHGAYLWQKPTVLVTEVKREEKLPHHRLTPRQVIKLTSGENDMYITRFANQKPILSTGSGIIQTNAGSWEALVLSMLKVNPPRTVGITPHQEINLIGSKKIMPLLIVRWIKSCDVKVKSKYCERITRIRLKI